MEALVGAAFVFDYDFRNIYTLLEKTGFAIDNLDLLRLSMLERSNLSKQNFIFEK